MPALVLDGDQPSALAIVRSLGRRGITVTVASSIEQPLAGLSRFSHAQLRYPDPLREEQAFIAWLAARQANRPGELVIPVTERTVVPILRQRSQLEDQRIAIAPSEALEQVLDKDRTLHLAMALGIPVPRSVAISALDQLPEATAALGFPVVVKPSRSVGQGDGQRVQLSVSYAHSPAELENQVGQALRFGAVILQEFFRADGVGIELIADQGEVRYAFQHRRLHEVPLTGGGSSLRVSEAVVPSLLKASQQLVRALGWHGVAMVEFKYQQATGEFRLMEINGRFWGSLPLAVAAGADFPAMLHELMSTGRVGDYPEARVGTVCRQLARDIDWLEHVLRKNAPRQLVQLPSASQVLRDSLMVFSPRHHFDVQSWRDLKPGLVDLSRIWQRQWSRITTALAQRQRLAAEWRSGGPGGVGQRTIARSQRVLFLCYGNINRSALAHAYAAGKQIHGLSFASAGFHAPAGRPPDPTMVDVAAQQGVALGEWRSKTLDAHAVEQADVILAMEATHLDRLWAEHPGARGKSFLLGAAAATARAQVEVIDPYGKPRQTYERVCRQVLQSVDAWLAAWPASKP